MFRSNPMDSNTRRPRFSPKPSDPHPSPVAERPFTAQVNSSGVEGMKNRLPSNTLEGMKVLWRQSQMAQSLRGPNRDGQMPVEELSDSSDSSGTSSATMFDKHQRKSKPKKRPNKDAGFSQLKKEKEQITQVADTSLTSKDSNKARDKKKEYTEVAVQAMRPASIDHMIDGRLNMLESRLRLEEMRSKSWCVRMTEAEDCVKQLQAQVKSLTAACANGTIGQQRYTQHSPRERGVWPTNSSEERRKTQRLGPKSSQLFDKDFTSEFNAILMQIRKDNMSEELVGDHCDDTKNRG